MINIRSTQIYQVLTSLTIEPLVFGIMFAFIMNLTVLSSMILDKACLLSFNYSAETCNLLSLTNDNRDIVIKLAGYYFLYSNLTNLFAAFFTIFIAPWSDKYGRKFPLLLSLAGSMLTDVGLILCAYFFDSRLEYLILARLPAEWTGGLICMLTIVYSHASEVSSEKNRILKYTALEIALGLGVSLGGLTVSFMYRNYHSYVYMYIVVAVIHALSFLWVLLVVKETTGLDIDEGWTQKARGVFVFENFTAGVVATCRRREGNTRTLLVLMLLSMCTIILNYEAFRSVTSIFVFHSFLWDPATYKYLSAGIGLADLLATFDLVPLLSKVFKLKDFTLGLIGTISIMARNLFMAFSPHHAYLYYMGLAVGILTPLSAVAIRTGISKLIRKDELGRVFSFVATGEVLIQTLGTELVSLIFFRTIGIYPNIIYSIGVVLLILPSTMFLFALKSTKISYNAPSVATNDHVVEMS